MKKYVCTVYHILQFIHLHPNCTLPQIKRFFKKTRAQICRKLDNLIQRGYIETIEIPARQGHRVHRRYYRTTENGERLIEQHNGNVCTILSSTVMMFLERFPKCEVPDSIDVNWDEESPYTHIGEINPFGKKRSAS